MTSNVLNRYEQPAMGSNDNPLIIEGSSKIGAENTTGINRSIFSLYAVGAETAVDLAYSSIPRNYKIINIVLISPQKPDADTVITFTKKGVGSMGTITILAAGSAGDRYTLAPSTNNTMLVTDIIVVSSDGAATTSPFELDIQIDYELI